MQRDSLAYNVQRFLMAREPTDRAAKGYSPLLPEADYLACGDKRPQAAPQDTCVGRRDRSAANTALPESFGPATKRWRGWVSPPVARGSARSALNRDHVSVGGAPCSAMHARGRAAADLDRRDHVEPGGGASVHP
jgi:hypothetical protein